ncbi:NAD(P)H-dependent oxidoreductase subunit E [Piscirickettsiaceae bacterium NZ-RLO2]|nr:NAD(P)H-dependent oxidoreductase subunit E [Piscirickettsiaceae bacterium NZ-RLO2]
MSIENGLNSLDGLTITMREQIDYWLTKFPHDQKQSASLAALMVVQKENNGYLTNVLMDAVADYLDMPAIAVYEVATFYSMYEHKPVGQHKICVCTNISCMLNGSDKIVEHLERRLGVKMGGDVTPDGKFSIKEVECLGACVNAPMFQIGDDYHEKLTPERVDQILDNLE